MTPRFTRKISMSVSRIRYGTMYCGMLRQQRFDLIDQLENDTSGGCRAVLTDVICDLVEVALSAPCPRALAYVRRKLP